MNKINFTITLVSDAEPGSGFGTELIDSLLPRDTDNRVFLPATHLKGIIRENLEKMPHEAVPLKVVGDLFGKTGCNGSLFHIENAVAPCDADIIEITRTRLNQFGVANPGSLRTGEAVALGTEFKGVVTCHPGMPEAYLDVLKLGFLSLFAVGGGRNRGAGACITTIADEDRTPGQILQQLSKIDFSGLTVGKAVNTGTFHISDKQVTLKLFFKAANPICVPDLPVVGNNIIRSGFSIPASAVQGAILHRINNISEETATNCFKSELFRAWPLHPTNKENRFSLCTSFTHKISKLPINEKGQYYFADETVHPYHWDVLHGKAHLVQADGVLLTDRDGVVFWKASDMARFVTAHGVHNGDRGGGGNLQKRNLFTVESMAPMCFTGLVSMPEAAADLLMESLEENPFVQLGKSRSVRGGGTLQAQVIQFENLSVMKNYEDRVFIVQSPVLVPPDFVGKPVEDIISLLAADAGFGKTEKGKAKGTMSTRFGWNTKMSNGRIGASVVICPGAVFKIEAPVKNLSKILTKGIGGGRERGYGAVLPHPGVAQALFQEKQEPRIVYKSSKNFGRAGFALWEKARDYRLSASQISRIRELTALNPDKALAYLEIQQKNRPAAIWNRWKGVIREIETGIREDAQHMVKVLKVCQDLLVADKEGAN